MAPNNFKDLDLKSFNSQLNVLAIGELEKGDLRFFSELDHDQYNVTWFDTSKIKERRFAFAAIWQLRCLLHERSFDIILCGRNAKTKSEFFLLRWLSNVWRGVRYSNSFACSMMLRNRGRLNSNPKLIAVNLGDSPIIDSCDHDLFKACDSYFKRELPPNRNNVFLYTKPHLRNRKRIQECFSSDVMNKIKPISLGIQPSDLYQRYLGIPKRYDIFFSGQLSSSTVRGRGLPVLQALKQAGAKVFFTEERLSYEEFLKLCASSYLVWSPEGYGWDCYRHYESALVGSVPVINYPTIERYAPLINGQHAFYYGSEESIQNGDGLYQVILNALKDPLRLEKMGKLAREHVLKYHTYIQLAKYVLHQEVR